MKRIKVMARDQSTGIRNRFRQIKLHQVVLHTDSTLESALASWQASYDAQCICTSSDFDWDAFHEEGRNIAFRIQMVVPFNTEVIYVEHDGQERAMQTASRFLINS